MLVLLYVVQIHYCCFQVNLLHVKIHQDFQQKVFEHKAHKLFQFMDLYEVHREADNGPLKWLKNYSNQIKWMLVHCIQFQGRVVFSLN